MPFRSQAQAAPGDAMRREIHDNCKLYQSFAGRELSAFYFGVVW